MLKKHSNTFKICFFGQTLTPENLQNTSKFVGWGQTLVAYKKSVTQNIFHFSFGASLFQQYYVTSPVTKKLLASRGEVGVSTFIC